MISTPTKAESTTMSLAVLIGHRVCITGYKDPGMYWIVKNSLGTTWGESGFFKMGYDQDYRGSLWLPTG